MARPLPGRGGAFPLEGLRSENFDAQQFLDEIATDIKRGSWIDPRAGRIAFDEWVMEWWRTTTKLRPTTRRGFGVS